MILLAEVSWDGPASIGPGAGARFCAPQPGRGGEHGEWAGTGGQASPPEAGGVRARRGPPVQILDPLFLICERLMGQRTLRGSRASMLGSANAPQGQRQGTAAVVTGQALGRSCSHSHSLEFRRLRRLWTGLACLVPPGPGGSASVLQCRGHRGASAHSRAWGTCSGGAVAQPDSVSQEGDTSQLSLQSPWPQLVIMGCECPPREPASCPGLQIRLRKGLASLGTPAASPGSVGLFLGLLWGGFWLGCVQYQGLTRRWTLKLEEEEGEERPSLPQEPCSCPRGYQRKKTPGQVAKTHSTGGHRQGGQGQAGLSSCTSWGTGEASTWLV